MQIDRTSLGRACLEQIPRELLREPVCLAECLTMDNVSDMSETLTICLPAAHRKALRARAATSGRTESELVRELIAGQLLRPGTVGEQAGRHLGRLDFAPVPQDKDPWREHLLRMNTRL